MKLNAGSAGNAVGSGGLVKGKRVLVVGASSAIGRAVGLRAVGQGASVACCARRADRLGEAVTAAGRGHAIAADVRDPADCERLAADAVALLGGLDVGREMGVLGSEEYLQAKRIAEPA